MKKYSSNFAPLVAVALVLVTAVVVMQAMGRLRPIGAVQTAEVGNVKLYAMEATGDAQDFYHNGEDYFIHDSGVRLATLGAGYEETFAIARVTDSDIALVVDSGLVPLHQGNTFLVDRGNGAVTSTGSHGLYWGTTNDETYLIYSDDSSGLTKMVFKSFSEISDEEISLGGGYGVEQVELSPDGEFMVVAAVWYPTVSTNYGKLLSINLESGAVVELATLSAAMTDGPELPFDDVIIDFPTSSSVSANVAGRTTTYELK